MAEWLPPDQAARDRIRTALDCNLLVEAGAGSGKTTAMVQRLVALILTGRATIEQIVGVTFTRKAAAELRERFQEALEAAYRSADAGSPGYQHARAALDNLDACFLGTIHAFCGRLLRERPLEVGVPPDFTEVYGGEEHMLRTEAWNRFLERVSSPHQRGGQGSRLLARLRDVGLAPRQLFDLYSQITENSDVRFLAPPAAPPDDEEIAYVRQQLNQLLTNALALMPNREPERGWDDLQKRVRSLRFSRDDLKWNEPVNLFNAAVDAVYGRKAVVQSRWPVGRQHRDLILDLDAQWAALNESTNRVREICMKWLAHRYVLAIRFARAAAAYYARERLRRGRLTFQDLLRHSAALLREHPQVCADLADRFRHILIDEFQDTDPLQAEVLFRLAAGGGRAEWLRLEPRPGALFVVGDPKQSIYRFRRADISLYLQVKQRFREFGEVVELTANFRSTGPIARLVNDTFVQRFPGGDAGQRFQAPYAPLITRPSRVQEGRLAYYRFDADPGPSWKRINIARPDSIRLAGWIRDRIASGERKPRDFLILTRTKTELSAFAHALERNNVPYEISGAGIGMEEELRELILLLKALADPGNAVLTLAVLEGLFFGLDHDTLHEHAIGGGHFHLLSRQRSGTMVDQALEQLQRLWELSRTETADVAIPLLVEELGILPYAAASELGATRAGALLFALDVLRQGSLSGRTSLSEAIDLLESTLTRDDAEAPLMPGATDVVRIMNLHRAKGLEAPVVVLANPIEMSERTPSRVLRRRADGAAEGWFAVFDATSRDRRKPIARPLHWDALEQEERLFEEAEEDRLMYVAATRAAEELIVARCDKQDAKSVWRCFHPLLDRPDYAAELVLQPQPPALRAELPAEPEQLQQAIEQVRLIREQQKAPTLRAGSITARFSGDTVPSRRARRRIPRALQLTLSLGAPENAEAFGHDREGNPIVQLGLTFSRGGSAALQPASVLEPAPRGAEWGEVVHQTLVAAARGVSDALLRSRARNDLLLCGAPTDSSGEPLWLDELMQLMHAMRESELWQRAARAERALYEVPFELLLSAEEWQQLSGQPSPGTPELLTGRIDLAFKEADGWVIADYKTDATDAKLKQRTAEYQRQVDLYGRCFERLTGETVKACLVVFTAVPAGGPVLNS